MVNGAPRVGLCPADSLRPVAMRRLRGGAGVSLYPFSSPGAPRPSGRELGRSRDRVEILGPGGGGGFLLVGAPRTAARCADDRRRRRRVVGGEWRVEEIFWRWRRWRGDFWEIFATGSAEPEGFLFLLPRGSVAVTICVWYCYNLARDTRAERALVRVSLRLCVGPRVGHGVGGWASTPCALRRVGVTRRKRSLPRGVVRTSLGRTSATVSPRPLAAGTEYMHNIHPSTTSWLEHTLVSAPQWLRDGRAPSVDRVWICHSVEIRMEPVASRTIQ